MWSTITANNDVRKKFGLNLTEGHILDFLYTSEVNGGSDYCEDGFYTKGGTVISRTLYLKLWDVKRALRNLEKIGLIDKNDKGHRKTSDEYKSLVPKKERSQKLKVVAIKSNSNELATNI